MTIHIDGPDDFFGLAQRVREGVRRQGLQRASDVEVVLGALWTGLAELGEDLAEVVVSGDAHQVSLELVSVHPGEPPFTVLYQPE